jgi:hypothetical protein
MLVVHSRGNEVREEDHYELFGVFTSQATLELEAIKHGFQKNGGGNWVSHDRSYVLDIQDGVELDICVHY